MKEKVLKRFKTPEAYKEYNRKRYQDNKRKYLLYKVNSMIKILSALGCTVTPPPEEQLNAAIGAYLENRPRRERIDWGELENET